MRQEVGEVDRAIPCPMRTSILEVSLNRKRQAKRLSGASAPLAAMLTLHSRLNLVKQQSIFGILKHEEWTRLCHVSHLLRFTSIDNRDLTLCSITVTSMQSVQRRFGKPRTADESQVAVLLKDFDDADKMLSRVHSPSSFLTFSIVDHHPDH